MSDTAVGFLIVGLGMLFVLGLVFAISSRPRVARTRPIPPPGVHLPPPSPLPVILSLAAALLGAGLVFRPDDQVANWFLAVPGAIVFVAGVVWWVGAAGRPWRGGDPRASHRGPGSARRPDLILLRHRSRRRGSSARTCDGSRSASSSWPRSSRSC